MGHSGAADGLDQGLLNDAVFHVEGELAGALLRRTPAYAMCEAANIPHLFGLCPCAFLGDRGRTVVGPLSHPAHFHDFSRVEHAFLLGK
ncbi:MAG: hypothetical protein ACD_75C01614G0002 [uncultured bacterium]|nr:MAG: hypothetical protein ACD_75C01614G0002 [uncultured bacterium]